MSYKGEIYDSHHHLWFYDGSQPRLPILSELRKNKDNLEKIVIPPPFLNFLGNPKFWVSDYTIQDLKKDIGDNLKVKGTNHIEAGWTGPKEDESFWLQKLNQEQGLPTCIIAGIDFSSDFDEALKGHLSCPSFRGFRVALTHTDDQSVFSFHGDPSFYDKPELHRVLEKLSENKLVFDVWCFHHQIINIKTIAQKFPNLQIVLNHIGSPIDFNKEETKTLWKKNIASLSEEKNVCVKVSGMGMTVTKIFEVKKEKGPDANQIATKIEPIVSHLLETFGMDRMIFGSNFPVDAVCIDYEPYVVGLSICLDNLKVSTEDQTKIFFSNSVRVYKPNF